MFSFFREVAIALAVCLVFLMVAGCTIQGTSRPFLGAADLILPVGTFMSQEEPHNL